MVKHIILWTLKDSLTDEQKETVKADIKSNLEALVGKVPGLVALTVYTDGRLASSNCDLMLDATLLDEATLTGYATHPAHVKVADTYVRPYTSARTCLDFEK